MTLCSDFKRVVSTAFLIALAGCAYAVPGHGADFQRLGLTPAERDQQTDPAISKLLDRKPLASFPATVAVVRIESGQYSNPKLQTCDTGAYTAALIDTRNGYIYGAAETSEKKNTLANCWGENVAADAVREQVKNKAFEKLCGELQTTWGQG